MELIAKPVKKVFLKEYAACIIDDFEDFLEEKDVADREEETGANIFGEDFDRLMEKVLDKLSMICAEAGIPYDRENWEEPAKNELFEDKTVVEIKENSGNKIIHYLGYAYYVGEPEDKPWHWVDYSGFYVPIREVLEFEKMGHNYELQFADRYKQYINDCSENEMKAYYASHNIIEINRSQ